MKMKFVHIGMDYIVPDESVLCILPYGSQNTKRLVSNAKMSATFIDATKRKKMRTVVVLKNGDVIGSILSSKALMGRFNAPPDMGFQNNDVDESDEITYL